MPKFKWTDYSNMGGDRDQETADPHVKALSKNLESIHGIDNADDQEDQFSSTFDNGNMSVSSSVDEDMQQDSSVESGWNGLEDGLHRRATKINWNPNISLLELAFKLKQAEHNVFGDCKEKKPILLSSSQLRNMPVDVSKPASVQTTPAPPPLRQAVRPNPNNANSHQFSDNRRSSEFPPQLTVRPMLLQPNLMNIPLPVAQMEHVGFGASVPVPVSMFVSGLPANFNQIIPAPVSMLSGADDSKTSVGGADRYNRIIPKPVSQLTVIDADNAGQQMFIDIEKAASGGARSVYVNPDTQQNDFDRGNPDEQRYHCQSCSYCTNSISHMRRHCAAIHTKIKPYRCYVCMVEFSRSEKVRDHFIAMHPNIVYEAHRSRKFGNSTQCAPPRDPTLPTAVRIRMRVQELFAGIEGEDVEYPVDPKRPFGCLRCSYSARDMWHLRRHVLDIHALRKHFNCRICRYATNRPVRLHVHMRGTHGEILCDHCDFSTTRIEQFTLHEKLCLPLTNKSIRCRSCLVEFPSRTDLATHLRNVHVTELLCCNSCPFFAFNEDDYLAHSDAHAQADRTCVLCGITFETPFDHNNHDSCVHLTYSNTSGLLICNVCNQETSPPGDMKSAVEHVRSHSPTKISCNTDGCTFQALLETTVLTHIENFHGTSGGGGGSAVESFPVVQASPQLQQQQQPPPLQIQPQPQPIPVPQIQQQPQPVPIPQPVQLLQQQAVIKTELDADAYPQLNTASPSSSAAAAVKAKYLNPASLTGTFACTICNRTPFKYYRSYEKHMWQHSREAQMASSSMMR